MHETWRCDLEEIVRDKGIAEGREQRCTQLEHRGRGLSAKDEVAQLGEDGRVGFLDIVRKHAEVAEIGTHFVQSVSECIITAGSSTKHLPIVDNEFVSAGRSLAFRDFLQGSDELHSRFKGESESVVCLRLHTLKLWAFILFCSKRDETDHFA